MARPVLLSLVLTSLMAALPLGSTDFDSSLMFRSSMPDSSDNFESFVPKELKEFAESVIIGFL